MENCYFNSILPLLIQRHSWKDCRSGLLEQVYYMYILVLYITNSAQRDVKVVMRITCQGTSI